MVTFTIEFDPTASRYQYVEVAADEARWAAHTLPLQPLTLEHGRDVSKALVLPQFEIHHTSKSLKVLPIPTKKKENKNA
jgi:hypothetical protein